MGHSFLFVGAYNSVTDIFFVFQTLCRKQQQELNGVENDIKKDRYPIAVGGSGLYTC